MTPLDLPLYALAGEEDDGEALNSSTESIQKLALEEKEGEGGNTVTVSVTTARLSDLAASRPADSLMARLLRERPQLAEQRVLYALSSARLAAVTLVAGKAAGSRAITVTLQAGEVETVEDDCHCEADAATCRPHVAAFRAAAAGGALHVCLDRGHHRLSGGVLHRLLDGCVRLEQLHLRVTSWRDIRGWQESGAFNAIRQLAVSSRSGCCDVHALGQLFPELRELSLTRDGERCDARCTCRFRANSLLPRLDTVQLENVCPTATAAIRAYAKSLHTLRLKSCSLTSPSCEYLNRPADYQRAVAASQGGNVRSFRDIIQAILRRKLITLPNIQIRRLQVTDACVDVALINRNFPCLKALEIECTELAAEAAPPASAPLWFPCLEHLQVRLNGPEPAEPCILARLLPRLTHYEQSFGSLRLSQLAASCPRLERLSLDPVLMEDAAVQLPQLRQLTVSWCGADTLLELADVMPLLESVRVLDPPFLDKRTWLDMEQRLTARHVQVALEW